MNSARRYLVIALSFAICMTVFAAFAPRIAHAVTATLVQVVNTYSNPAAVARADDPGRSPVRLYLSGALAPTFQGTQQQLLDANTGAPYTVPAGKRLVVERVSADAFDGSSPSGQIVTVLLGNFSGSFEETLLNVPMILQGSNVTGAAYSNTIEARDYVDEGQQYWFTIVRNVTTGPMSFRANVAGHLVDCTNGGGC